MEVDGVPGWIVLAALTVMTAVVLYLYITWTYSTWARCDVPGPKPVPLFGNILEVRKKGLFSAVLEWRKQYGKTIGVYFMRDPMLLTTDLHILKEVFLKDFSNFTNRANVPRSIIQYPTNFSLAFAEDDTWRRQRHTMTPTFSTIKLKLMGPYINRCCDNLSGVLVKHTQKREVVDVKRIFGAYTMDVIAGTAFGCETDTLLGENNALVDAIVSLFKNFNSLDWRSVASTLFPFLVGVFRFFADASKDDNATVIRLIDQIITDRKTSGGNGRVDFLQLLLEAEATEADIAAKPQDRQLTRTEIIAQSILIFAAGYDTTATMLQYMTYLLALNPEKQEKLYDEIIHNIGDAPPTYDSVMNIKYLDNVIRETLRWFPPTPMVGRRAAEARTIKGVSIRAGACVGVPIYALMHDEEIFREPEKFIPERFDDENLPTIVREVAFGMGPRQCIGMRLVLYEAKMAAVTLVRKFKFVKVRQTPEIITFRIGTLASPEKPILVGTEFRK